MANKGKISYAIGLEKEKLRSDAEESKRILHGISTTAITEGQKMDAAFKKVGVAIAGAFTTAAAISFAKKIIDIRGEIQSLEISFRTLVGSQAKADALFADIRKFAVNTPMMMKDLAAGAQTLLGFGMAAENIMPILRSIGDISMGNTQKFQSLTLAFAQATSTGKLMGQDFLQMVNAGFNPLNQMAETTGKSVAKLKDEMSKGKISADMLKKAFIDAASEGGKYNGMLEQQSKGIQGAISNLRGAIDDAMNGIGESMQKPFTEATELATVLVKHYEEVGKAIMTLVTAYGAYKAALISVVAVQRMTALAENIQLILMFRKELGLLTAAQQAFNLTAMKNPYIIMGAAIAGLIAGFITLTRTEDKYKDTIKECDNKLEEQAKRMKALEKESSFMDGLNKKVAQSTAEQTSKVELLMHAMKDETASIDDRKRAIKQMQGIIPSFQASIDKEGNLYIKNKEAVYDYIKSLNDLAMAKALQSKREELVSQRVDAELKRRQTKKDIEDKQAAANAAEAKAKAEREAYNKAMAENAKTTSAGAGDPLASFVTSAGADKANRTQLDEAQSAATAANKQLAVAKGELVILDKQIVKTKNDLADLDAYLKDNKIDLTAIKQDTGGVELTEPEKEKAEREAQKLKDEQAKRNEQIRQNAEDEKRLYDKTELDKRQAKISAMQDGYDKEMLQNKLNYDTMIAETKKREEDMIKALEDTKVLEWKNQHPKATQEQEIGYRQSLNLTSKDLAPEQLAQIREFAKIAGQIWQQANQSSLDKMLEGVLTYEEKRAKITEEYAKKRENLEYTHDANGNRTGKTAATSGNLAELDRQRDEALTTVDEEFASRESSYQAWMEAIANMTLDQLKIVLDNAKKELDKAKESGEGGTKLAQARAKVAAAQKALSKANAKDNLAPSKRTLKQWQELNDVLQEGVKGFDDLGDAIGGTAGELMKAAAQVASGTLAMINGIMTLTQSSATSMQATGETASKTMQTVEKASVILAIVSAALQVATAIANLFNNDNQKQKEIEALQNRIDQLQWELDNAEAVRLRKSVNSLQLIKNTIMETRMELYKEAVAIGDVRGAFNQLFKGVANNQNLLQKSAQKVADVYANIAYTANKALGNNKYSSARKELENIAQQQILLQEQINKEESKKKTDKGAVQEYKNKIEELGNQAVEVINGMVEDIIGGSSEEIANQLSDAFFEAFQNGEDYAQAWGDKVNDIVADVMKRMLVQKYLEEPLGQIFDKYKAKWFQNGQFAGLDAVINSMQGFAADLNAVGSDFAQIWESLPDSVKNMFTVTANAREASEKGIATASQESVDELSGRATAIQGHTYSISENTKLLVQNTNDILNRVMNIDRHTESMAERMDVMDGNIKELKDTVNDIALKGLKMK